MATESIEIRIRADGAREASQAIRAVGDAGAQAARGADRAERNIKKMGRSAATTRGQMRSLGREANRVGGIVNAIFGAVVIRQAAQAVDSFTQVQNRLRLITDGEADLGNLTEVVFQQAQDTRVEFAAQAELVSRISRASQSLGASQADVLNVSQAIAQSFAISGASTQETIAASRQLAQGLQSGRFAGDELRSVLENNARIGQVLADNLGVSVGEIRTMGAEGKLGPQQVFDAILKDVEKLNSEFSTIQPTIEQGVTTAANALQIVLGDLDIGGALGEGFQGVGRSIQALRPDIVELVGEARLFTTSLFFALEEFFLRVNQGVNIVRGTVSELEKDIAEIREDNDWFDSIVEGAADLGDEINDLPPAVQSVLALIPGIGLGLSAAADGAVALEEATDNAAESQERQLALIDELNSLDTQLLGLGERRTEELNRQRKELEAQIAALRELIANPAKASEESGGGGEKKTPLDPKDITAANKFLQEQLTEVEKIEAKIAEVSRLTAAGAFADGNDVRIMQALNLELIAANQELDGTAGKLEEATGFFTASLTEVENIEAAIARVNLLSEEGFFDGVGDPAVILARLGEDLVAAKEKAEETTDAFATFAEQAARNIQDSLANFLFDPFEDGLDGMLRAFIDTIRRMVAELLAAKLLQSFASSFGGGGGVFGTFATALGGAAGGGNAMGGTMKAGETRLVGERGPEPFTASRNGVVTPNSGIGGPPAPAPIVIVEQDPQAVVQAIGTAAGRSEIFKAIQADPAQYRAALGVAS